MYIGLLVLGLVLGVVLVARGVTYQRPRHIAAGVCVALGTVGLLASFSFWAEMLWFDELGYSQRFWTVVLARVGYALLGAAFGALAVWLLTRPIPSDPPVARIWPEVVGALSGLVWGLASWSTALQFTHRVSTTVVEPMFHRDVSFYLFALPLYDGIVWLLGMLVVVSLIAATLSMVTRDRLDAFAEARPGARRPVYFALGVLGLVLAWGKLLDIYHLAYSRWGAAPGPGWTDMNVRVPGYWVASAVAALGGIAFIVAAASPRISARIEERTTPRRSLALLGIPAIVAAVWVAALVVAPGLFQWLKVKPTEITLEERYIANNIRFTRDGFQLDRVEPREFPVSDRLTPEIAREHQSVLREIRIWDPRALLSVYKQFQELRLYYEMSDIDIDRYDIHKQYRQVMVAAREMNTANLPLNARTFVNVRFKYTHGYGLAMSPVSELTPDGLPALVVKDIPPSAAAPELQITRPEIYFGERTQGYVVVNTREEEFDYPRGEQNVYARYQGTGGVPLSNLWRRLVFGWALGDGTTFLLSKYPTRESRVMFHREVRERVTKLAPFLTLDADPYITIVDGKLYWIIDAYTKSSRYPHSTPYGTRAQEGAPRDDAAYLEGANYVRNSVKAVVDAYTGAVDLYVYEPDDPLVRVWKKIFPGLLKPKEQMPKGLQRHVRYPEGLLLAQGHVYAKYHMTDPSVFYNQEDLWVPATQKDEKGVQAVRPYYVMWDPHFMWQPPPTGTEFIIMQPFTPKGRQVLVGWLAGMCDDESYGRIEGYRFPKDKWILGTQQVETKIDQDRFLSAQLSLWDQRGSKVIRGDVLVIPIGQTLLYVEPIYLQAEAAAYPELRVVVVMQQDKMSYADTLEQALDGLVRERGAGLPSATQAIPGTGRAEQRTLRHRASEAFDRYLRLMGEGKLEDAARALEELRRTLQEPEAPDASPSR